MQFAWFTPWTPQTSGIATCSRDLVALLAHRGHGMDVFVDHRLVPHACRQPDAPPPAGQIRVQSAHDFPWRHHRQQYDAVVYQVGNSRVHDFLWPYLFRYPGVSILHDTRLHHARARALLAADRQASYREEFRFNQPDAGIDAAELAVHGFDGAYYYLWPMLRAVIEASHVTAVLSRGAASTIAQAFPDQTVEYVPLGHGRATQLDDAERDQIRSAWGLRREAVVFGIFGGLSHEKRIGPIFRAFARLRRRVPHAHLLLAGAADPLLDTRALAASLDIADAVAHLGMPGDDDFDRAIAAVDISLHLRWPSAGETSGPWLRALAAGRASVVIDLPHQAHVPALDPRDWRPLHGSPSVAPITVAVDVLDEDHSLGLAMDRLASDAAMRARLGSAARRYWEQEHTPDHMADALETILTRPTPARPPSAVLPASLRPDPADLARELVAEFGDLSCELL